MLPKNRQKPTNEPTFLPYPINYTGMKKGRRENRPLQCAENSAYLCRCCCKEVLVGIDATRASVLYSLDNLYHIEQVVHVCLASDGIVSVLELLVGR